ncbi:MFS transporter [Enterobacterales bacterium AE_CKDN230030158-1A_HGKHYDSX7]
MIRVSQGRLNLLLGSTAFALSSAGSVLLHIVLALAVFRQTGSALATSLFVALQWMPAFLVVLYRSDWEHGLPPRTRWYLLDLLAAALTLPVLLFIDGQNYLAIVLILLARGVLDQVNRINKTIAARVLFPPEKVTHYAAFLQSSYHIGIGLAAIAGVFFAQYFALETVVLIDALSFVISAALIALTRPVAVRAASAPQQRRSFAARFVEYREALASNPRLLLCSGLMPLTATFFQGTYSVLQPIFPVDHFQLGVSAVTTSYVLASVGIMLGSWSFSLYCKRSRLFDGDFRRVRRLALGGSIVAAALYLITVGAPSPLLSATCFALMILLFEFVWMMGYSGTVAYAPASGLGSVFGISFALGCLFASLLSAVLGLLLDLFGRNYLVLVALLMFAYLAGLSLLLRPERHSVALATEE